MRHLYLLQGIPGSGKSTFVEQEGLTHHTVSSDALRLLYRGPEMSKHGTMIISSGSDVTIWGTLMAMVKERMRAGDLTVVDATHTRRREIEEYRQLAEHYRYQTFIVSFRDTPLETCLARNGSRAALRMVPDKAIHDMFNRLRSFQAPKWVQTVTPTTFRETLKDPVIDGAAYRHLHVVGDLQGCDGPLANYLAEGIYPQDLYIFVGDLVDRGLENASVIRRMLAISHLPNVRICEGNHERHLRSWINGEQARSSVFEKKTKPELEAAGISREDVAEMLAKLVDAVVVNWRGRRILVSHGGLTSMPEPDRLAFVPSSQLIKGVGPHDFDVDSIFAANTPEGVIQVHGHRNEHNRPVLAAERSFNLEGRVEFGGYLRIVQFMDDGTYQTHEIANSRYDVKTASEDDEGKSLPSKKSSKRKTSLSVAEMIDEMRGNEHVIEKKLPGNLASFNFSRQAFRKGIWNKQTIRARGMFVNTETAEIVARSYDKFFNLGENEANTLPGLAGQMKFPAKVWVKENGYLGIVGYNPEADEVIYASKSTTESDFAGWLKDILHNVQGVDPATLKEIASRGLSLVFEVIDPVNDPHIIKYETKKVVLLDIIRNDVEFRPLPYEQLQGLGKRLGVEVKALHRTLANFEEFCAFVGECTAENPYLVNGEHVEGFVIEDANRFMVKIKQSYYSFWKRLRGLAASVAAGKQLRPLDSLPQEGRAFIDWFKSNPDMHQLDIISLREKFLKECGSKVETA